MFRTLKINGNIIPQKIKRHPDNVPGDFYVSCDECIACEAPYHEAPELMGNSYTSKNNDGCYFKKQPVTPEEIEQACSAVCVSCVEAVRYAGNDPEILHRLEELNSRSSCDVYYETDPPIYEL